MLGKQGLSWGAPLSPCKRPTPRQFRKTLRSAAGLMRAEPPHAAIREIRMTPPSETTSLKIESFTHAAAGGSKTLLRPMAGQRFPTNMLVEGNKSLIKDYPVGSRFKVMVSPMKRAGGGHV